MVGREIAGYIGSFGPAMILCVIVVEEVYDGASTTRIVWLLLWQPMSIILNTWLKEVINEERPPGGEHINMIEEVIDIGSKGMPSGHAQMVASALTFVLLSGSNATLAFITGLQSVITIWQRLAYKKHTIEQVMAGLFVGAIYTMLFLSYYTSLKQT
jgi:membrane-associated phospholipid phosphatase